MVICIRMYKVLEERYSSRAKVLPEKWANDHDFGFNIGDAKEWRKFLLRYTVNGMPLPRKTKDGNPVGYQVFRWGSVKGVTGYQKGYHVLYPGNNENGERLPVAFYGRLDIPIKYWGEKGGI